MCPPSCLSTQAIDVIRRFRRTTVVTWIIGALLTLMIALPVTSVPLHAQGSPTPPLRTVSDDEVNKVAKGLYCPVCQNVPLEVCETEACARWREQVRELIAQGDTEDQIRQYFIERFGPQTVGAPTNPTAQLLTQTLPYVLIAVVGGAVIGLSLITWRRRQITENTTARQPSEPDRLAEMDDYRARLEREVKERD